LSEGAGVLILESLDSALRRNAEIYGEIIGFGTTTDAYQMAGTDPSGSQRVRAIKLALHQAGVNPEAVDYINAHATATRQNDVNETMVVKKVFGEHSKRLLISGTKSMIGHTQGACGVLETIATLLALKKDIVHPTINYQTPDEECDLDYVPNQAVKRNVSIALKNTFAFGGKNTILVLRAWENGVK